MAVDEFIYYNSSITCDSACNLLNEIIEINKNKDIINYIQPSNSNQFTSIFNFIKEINIFGVPLKNKRSIIILSCKDSEIAIVYNSISKKLLYMIID